MALVMDDPQEWLAFGCLCSADGRALPVSGLGVGDGAADAWLGVWQSNVVVEGMYCAACALTIEDALLAVPGVLQVEVSAASHRARIRWDARVTRPSQWMAALDKAGYSAVPAMDVHARDRRQVLARRALWRWLVAGFCMMQVMMYAWPAYVAQPGDLSAEMEHLLRWASWVLTLPVVFFACGAFFSGALRDVAHRRISMDLPVALGMAVTFAVSTAGTFAPAGWWGREVYFDSFTMFVFFLLTGRWLQERLHDRTAGALGALINRLPDSVQRRDADGGFSAVALRRLQVGDVVRIVPGQAFAADGVVVRGSTLVDEALLTGESKPQRRRVGDAVVAGSYNVQAAVEVQVHRMGEQTRFAHIVALMESALLHKPPSVVQADKVAQPFLVLVLVMALAAGAWWWPTDPAHAVMVAVAVLIVTCPCALSLATPVAMLTAAGTLARRGVLVRKMQALEVLAHADTVIFDKTGTLTTDGMGVHAVHISPDSAAGQGAPQVLALVAALARQSSHPVSRALVAAAQAQGWSQAGDAQVRDVQEVPGAGLSAMWVDWTLPQGAARAVRLGSARYALGGAGTGHAQSLHAGAPQGVWSQVVLSQEVAPDHWVELACCQLTETLRPEAAAVVQALQQAGITVQLLSGDHAASVAAMGQQAGIAADAVFAQCTPEDKWAHVQRLQAQGRRVVMVGDGLNDGPALAGADVSLAFGCAVPLAQAQADVVVLTASLWMVAHTWWMARRTMRVVRQNLCWALLYNAVCVPLAVMGAMPAWLAGLGMAASSLWVVLNAARLARDASPFSEPPGTLPSNSPSAPRGAVAQPLAQRTTQPMACEVA